MALRKFGDGWQIDYYEPPKKAGKRFAKEEIQLMNGLTSGNRSNGQNWSNFSPNEKAAKMTASPNA